MGKITGVCVSLAGIAAYAPHLCAQCVPDMTMPVKTYEEHVQCLKAWDYVDQLDAQIKKAEEAGDDASALKSHRHSYWEEHLKRYWDAEGGDKIFELKKKILFPTTPEVNKVLTDTDPAKARQLVEALYRDFGHPAINYGNVAGIVLPVFEELSYRELDHDTRAVLVEGLTEFSIKAVEQEAISNELTIMYLAGALYRLSSPEDETALATSQSLYGYALAQSRAKGYKDHEEQIMQSLESTLGVDVAIAAIGEDDEATAPAIEASDLSDELKEARRDFRLAIRNPASVELAAKVLRHVRRDWGSVRINAEMARSYTRYGIMLVRLLQSPPPNLTKAKLEQCKDLFNQGMVDLTRRCLDREGWDLWRAVVTRMDETASPELRSAISDRIASIGSDRSQGYALKSLTIARTALGAREHSEKKE